VQTKEDPDGAHEAAPNSPLEELEKATEPDGPPVAADEEESSTVAMHEEGNPTICGDGLQTKVTAVLTRPDVEVPVVPVPETVVEPEFVVEVPTWLLRKASP
jgi:hypothetical protein